VAWRVQSVGTSQDFLELAGNVGNRKLLWVRS